MLAPTITKGTATMNTQKDIDTIWQVLWAYREDLIPEGDEIYDNQWGDICEAMERIREALGLPDIVEANNV